MPKKPSKNMGRLNADIKRELADIIGGLKDPRAKAGLVTITRVETTSDLSQCKVYVSVLNGGEKGAAGVVKALNDAKGHVRSTLASRMHIRRAPEMFFVEDGSAEYAQHINELLNSL